MDDLVALLAKQLLTKSTVADASKAAGTTDKQTTDTLTSALPSLAANLGKIDLSKIGADTLISSLLGSKQTSVVNAAAKVAGITGKQVTTILTSVAPTLLAKAQSLLKNQDVAKLAGAVLGNGKADGLAGLAGSVLKGLASDTKKK